MQTKVYSIVLVTIIAVFSSAFLTTTQANPTLDADDETAATGAAADPATSPWNHTGAHRFQRRDRGNNPTRAALMDLRAIEKLYYVEGRGKDLPAFYDEILGKTNNPRLRNYIYMRKARLQMVPANTDKAIATLRQSLDENLKRAQ